MMKAFSLLICTLVYFGAEQLYKVGLVPEGYNPEQPIAFSHKIHAGANEMDCCEVESYFRGLQRHSVWV